MNVIEKEVVKKFDARKKVFTEFDAITATNRLLEWKGAQERFMIQKLSPECVEIRIDGEREKKMQFENLERQFGNKVVNISDIKALCLKYNLRFLPSTRFTGRYEPTTMGDLTKFAQVNNIELNEGVLTSKFFIMAPSNVFKLSEGVKRDPVIKIIDRDPSLFYKVSDKEFVHLKTWGADFSFTRLIRGHFMRSYERHLITMFILLGIAIFALLKQCNWFANDIIVGIVSAIPAFVLAIVSCARYDGFFSNQVWDSDKKNEQRKVVFEL